MAHVWLATSSGDCLVGADQIYDITCVGKTLSVYAGLNSSVD